MLSLRAVLLPLDLPVDTVLKESVDMFDCFCDFCDFFNFVETLRSCLRDATESFREEDFRLSRRDFSIGLLPREEVENFELFVDFPLFCEYKLLVVFD